MLRKLLVLQVLIRVFKNISAIWLSWMYKVTLVLHFTWKEIFTALKLHESQGCIQEVAHPGGPVSHWFWRPGVKLKNVAFTPHPCQFGALKFLSWETLEWHWGGSRIFYNGEEGRPNEGLTELLAPVGWVQGVSEGEKNQFFKPIQSIFA